MATLVEWFPATGASIAFTTGATTPYRIFDLKGLEPVQVNPLSVKSPNQPGDTAVDVVVPGRVLTLTGLIQAADVASAWTLRSTLARALAQQPTRLGETYALGRLRITVDGRTPLEVECVPRSVSLERPTLKAIVPMDIEFYAPFPYWREIADTQILFTAAGGFTFAAQFPLAMASNNVQVDVDNIGDVDTPILVRMYGDITTGRIKNLTTGETLEITGNLPATKYWEINTGFGTKYVREYTIATGAYVSAMSKINLALPDFWSLRPGLNTVKFEADVNTSGRAELYWRTRYSGF